MHSSLQLASNKHLRIYPGTGKCVKVNMRITSESWSSAICQIVREPDRPKITLNERFTLKYRRFMFSSFSNALINSFKNASKFTVAR